MGEQDTKQKMKKEIKDPKYYCAAGESTDPAKMHLLLQKVQRK